MPVGVLISLLIVASLPTQFLKVDFVSPVRIDFDKKFLFPIKNILFNFLKIMIFGPNKSIPILVVASTVLHLWDNDLIHCTILILCSDTILSIPHSSN